MTCKSLFLFLLWQDWRSYMIVRSVVLSFCHLFCLATMQRPWRSLRSLSALVCLFLFLLAILLRLPIRAELFQEDGKWAAI